MAARLQTTAYVTATPITEHFGWLSARVITMLKCRPLAFFGMLPQLALHSRVIKDKRPSTKTCTLAT